MNVAENRYGARLTAGWASGERASWHTSGKELPQTHTWAQSVEGPLQMLERNRWYVSFWMDSYLSKPKSLLFWGSLGAAVPTAPPHLIKGQSAGSPGSWMSLLCWWTLRALRMHLVSNRSSSRWKETAFNQSECHCKWNVSLSFPTQPASFSFPQPPLNSSKFLKDTWPGTESTPPLSDRKGHVLELLLRQCGSWVQALGTWLSLSEAPVL